MAQERPGQGSNVTEVRRDASGVAQGLSRKRPTLRWSDTRGAHTQSVEGRAVLGAAPGADVVVADPTVSRLHADLEVRDDGLWVRDLDSRNGTSVDGVRVSGARVPDGGKLVVGGTEIAVHYGDAPVAVELWQGERFEGMYGRSAQMRELFARLGRVAPTESTVLIHGETGTGKELVAEAIHRRSGRAQGPFIIVDCAALPENLLESELFGHTRGAFTGAVAQRAGAIESADGGTIFLDEIGELPLAMQPKLLRAIESRMVRRLGESQHRKVDVRFVSATHRDLHAMVGAGAFREDLFFRLSVLPLTVPPLRARREDIPGLVTHFLPAGTPPGAIPQELLRELSARPWLGNVRELRNFVERALALGAREALAMMPRPQEAPAAPRREDETALPSVSIDEPFKDLRERWLDHLEREYLKGMLARHAGNVSAVAHAAGLDRTYVHRLIRKHDL